MPRRAHNDLCTYVERNEDLITAGYAHQGGADEIRGRRSLLTVTGRKHGALHEFFDQKLSKNTPEPRRAMIKRTIDAQIDRIAPLGGTELDKDFAERVPIAVVAQLLGLRPEETVTIQSDLSGRLGHDPGSRV